MNHPLRANLEITILDGTEWVRCSKCQRKHCRADEDWRHFCKVRLLPPTKAGETDVRLEWPVSASTVLLSVLRGVIGYRLR